MPELRCPHRILIVEDDEDAAEVTCALFAMHGHECRAAPSGEQAIDEADRFHPDIALVDLSLPDISGYDVAERLRAVPELRGIRLVAVSGWSSDDHVQRSRGAGFEAYVVKPLDAAKLASLLARFDRTVAAG
jgi:two-component system CheB/CheR fusion protein